MSSADAVAALPGGGAFAALWNQVNGDPGAISDLAARITSTAGKVQDSAHHISTSAGEVGDAWHGPAATAFTGYMHHFGSAASSVHAAMDKAATAIEHAGTAVETAKHQLDAIASRILDTVAQFAKLKDTPENERFYQLAAEQAVREGCAEAQPVVQALISHLEQAAASVHGAMASGGFVAMTPAGTGTYLPKKGHPIEWRPIPHDVGAHGATTAPQGGGSGSAAGSGTGGADGFTGGPGGAGSSGGPPAAQPTGNVKTWIDEAKRILEQHGYSADELNSADINTIIEHESSGNPHAENLTDSNAAAGHPSKGLMQTIDSTFDSYSLPGHKDIWNPVDNIIAGVRYAISRYGSLDSVPGVQAVHDGGSYVGY